MRAETSLWEKEDGGGPSLGETTGGSTQGRNATVRLRYGPVNWDERPGPHPPLGGRGELRFRFRAKCGKAPSEAEDAKKQERR